MIIKIENSPKYEKSFHANFSLFSDMTKLQQELQTAIFAVKTVLLRRIKEFGGNCCHSRGIDIHVPLYTTTHART